MKSPHLTNDELNIYWDDLSEEFQKELISKKLTPTEEEEKGEHPIGQLIIPNIETE